MAYRDYEDRNYRRDDRDDRDYRRRSPSPVRDYRGGSTGSVSASSHRQSPHRSGGALPPRAGGRDSYPSRMGGVPPAGVMDHPGGYYPHETGGREVCRDYLRGVCARGARCPYVHMPLGAPMPYSAPPPYLAGGPPPYHHSAVSLPPALSSSGPSKPSRSGPEVCRDHLFRKNCTRGKQCPYLHVVLADKDAERGSAGSKRKRDDGVDDNDEQELAGDKDDYFVNIDELERDNRILRSENKEVREENKHLREENLRFREDNIRLRKLIEDAKKERHSPDLNIISPL